MYGKAQVVHSLVIPPKKELQFGNVIARSRRWRSNLCPKMRLLRCARN